MIVSGPNTFMFGDGAVFITSSVAGRCACSRTAHLFVSRNGSTHCLDCESKHFTVAPTECDPTDDGPNVASSFQKAIV